MSEKMVREKIAKTILNLADAMETGSFQEKPLIGIAVSETEHGLDNIREGVRIAESRGFRACAVPFLPSSMMLLISFATVTLP